MISGNEGTAGKRMPACKPVDHAKKGRSRVTNGATLWLDNKDKRGPVARRFRDLVLAVTSDLGGEAELSEGQRQIIRRIASLSVWCESEEAKMAAGMKIDINEFQRTANSLRRLVESLGIERKAKTIPSLAEYMEKKRREETEEAEVV